MDLLYNGKPLPKKSIEKKPMVKKAYKRNDTPLEHSEQCTVHQWLQWNNIDHTATANANALSFLDRGLAITIMNKLKASGLSTGFPDLLVFTRKKLLLIEMKRRKGGVISEEQKEWVSIANSYDYCHACVCHGADEAIEEVKRWI